MLKNIFLLLLCASIYACNRQDKHSSNINHKIAPYFKNISNLDTAENGIIYFSFDNGNSWKNVSTGLPEKVSIGLGGIAASKASLMVATKEYGVYEYNAKDHNWVNLATSKAIIEANIGASAVFTHSIFVGTQDKGIFYSNDNGKTWLSQNDGLNNLTIRRFYEFNDTLYACTNDGFYFLIENLQKWELAYGFESLQVNGATNFKGTFYIGTNKGIYKKLNPHQWINISPSFSVHNISSDSTALYAMTYNELLLSSSDGLDWRNIQAGLPKNLYTFNVLNHHDRLFAGQWDGIYSKSQNELWMSSSSGLPSDFAVTNLISFNQVLVVTTSARKLKAGMEVRNK